MPKELGKRQLGSINSILLITGILILAAALFLVGNPDLVPENLLKKVPVSAPVKIVEPELVKVSITRDGFAPEYIKIKKGTQIIFTNTDVFPHRVSSDPHPTHTNLSGFDSPSLLKNDSYAFIFEKTGTFGFHDHFNPFQSRGVVDVVE